MCVCLALWGERVCIIPQGPGSYFCHLFSSGCLRSWDSAWGWMDGALPSYTWFRRCRSRGTNTCSRCGQGFCSSPCIHPGSQPRDLGGAGLFSLAKAASPALPRQLQAHLSAALVWVSLCLTPLQPDLGPAVTCSFGPFGFYFLFFKVERIARI